MCTFRNNPFIPSFSRRGRLLAAVVVLAVLCALFLNKLPSRAGGVPPYNWNSIWNRPIDANPALDPYSTAKIAKLTAASYGIIHINGIDGPWSVPVYFADGSTPRQQVCDAWHYSPCETVPIPNGMLPSPDSDAKAVIIDFSSYPQHAWSFWQMSRDQNGNWWVNRGAFGYGIDTQDGDGIHNHSGGDWGGRGGGW